MMVKSGQFLFKDPIGTAGTSAKNKILIFRVERAGGFEIDFLLFLIRY